MGVSCTACGHHYKPGEKFHNHQNDSFAPWDDTPAPLSADSLRAIFEPLEKSGFPTDSVMKAIDAYTAAALQSERQRIADSLPEKQEPSKYRPPSWNKDKLLNPEYANERIWGWNAAIEAVRAVLIPPTGGLETSDTASAGGNQVDTPVEPQ